MQLIRKGERIVTVVEVVRKKEATEAIKTKVSVGNEEQEKGKVRRKKQRKIVKRQIETRYKEISQI